MPKFCTPLMVFGDADICGLEETAKDKDGRDRPGKDVEKNVANEKEKKKAANIKEGRKAKVESEAEHGFARIFLLMYLIITMSSGIHEIVNGCYPCGFVCSPPAHMPSNGRKLHPIPQIARSVLVRKAHGVMKAGRP